MRKYFVLLVALFVVQLSIGQSVERERPTEWKKLIPGGQFKDLFMPMEGEILTDDVWGAQCVLPRFVDNGIEDNIRSYWGGNILIDSLGMHHMYVCGWNENSPKGHMYWPKSTVYHATSKDAHGPYVIQDTIGKGHNPEVFRAKNGQYVLYTLDGRYVSDHLEGPWVSSTFEFDPRDRKIVDGTSNMTFASREDGSVLMVCRGGGVWISKDGLSAYNQITHERVYPAIEGRFEDPVIWKDHVQYHLVVNDWYGRIAFHLRSKDGVEWVTDAGEAYTPGIAIHPDGTKEDWFKYERMKVLQDEYGRVTQANFAVIDTIKWFDLPNDGYSSKNITIPFNKGVLAELLNKKVLTKKTKELRVKVLAEAGFDPMKDMDFTSLRFGASTEVNFGRGAKLLRKEQQGKDVLLVFDAQGCGITADEFAPKLLGRYKNGQPLYGYTRVPWIDYIEPMVSARAVRLEDGVASVVLENFGQVKSGKLKVDLFACISDSSGVKLGSAKIKSILPYGSEKVEIELSEELQSEVLDNLRVQIEE